MQLPEGKHIYFASDFHLGIPNLSASILREKKICAWLDEIAPNAHTIFLVGDLLGWTPDRKRKSTEKSCFYSI